MSESIRPWTLSATFSIFTPGEVEGITSLTTVMQRDWRGRGLMPSSPAGEQGKHNRFDAFHVAQIWTMKMLADRGIGPQASQSISARCAEAIVFHALKFGGSKVFEGDHWATLNWLPEADRPKALSEKIRSEIRAGLAAQGNRQKDIAELDAGDYGAWEQQQGWLAPAIFEQRGLSTSYPSMFFWWPTGEVELGDIGVFETRGPTDPRFAGAAIILDLGALGEVLAVRAGKPLVRIAFDSSGAR